MYRNIITIFIFLALICTLHAQDSDTKPSDGRIIDFGVGMGLNFPIGKLKERYGSNLNLIFVFSKRKMSREKSQTSLLHSM